MDLKVFVDTDSDIRLARRLKRDISDRGRDLTSVLKQYNTFVKPVRKHAAVTLYSTQLTNRTTGKETKKLRPTQSLCLCDSLTFPGFSLTRGFQFKCS